MGSNRAQDQSNMIILIDAVLETLPTTVEYLINKVRMGEQIVEICEKSVLELEVVCVLQTVGDHRCMDTRGGKREYFNTRDRKSTPPETYVWESILRYADKCTFLEGALQGFDMTKVNVWKVMDLVRRDLLSAAADWPSLDTDSPLYPFAKSMQMVPHSRVVGILEAIVLRDWELALERAKEAKVPADLVRDVYELVKPSHIAWVTGWPDVEVCQPHISVQMSIEKVLPKCVEVGPQPVVDWEKLTELIRERYPELGTPSAAEISWVQLETERYARYFTWDGLMGFAHRNRKEKPQENVRLAIEKLIPECLAD